MPSFSDYKLKYRCEVQKRIMINQQFSLDENSNNAKLFELQFIAIIYNLSKIALVCIPRNISSVATTILLCRL